MRGHAAVTLIGLCVLAGPVAIQAAAKGWKPILLERVAVGVADLVPGPAAKPVLTIPVTNKSADAARVAVSVRSSGSTPDCEARLTLAAHQDTVVRCSLSQITADVDYVISVAALDSTESDTLETGSSSARFSKSDVKTLDGWLKATALPKTFKHVEKVDKVTAGTTMSSMFGAPRGDGTLTVDAGSVTYDAKKNSVTIPALSLRDVRITSDPKQPWVVVDYEEGGEKKSVSFKPNVYKGGASADEMAVAIRSAMAGWQR